LATGKTWTARMLCGLVSNSFGLMKRQPSRGSSPMADQDVDPNE
jgi:hypothetical protein